MTKCPNCGGTLVATPGTFHWRGQDFAGLVCEPCNALFDNPGDSFMAAANSSHLIERRLRSALERVAANYKLTLAGKTVRDVSETFAEVGAALAYPPHSQTPE